MGLKVPAAESLESPKEENEVLWAKATDKTGFVYSGKNTFKSGEGEFTTVGQGDSFAGSHAYLLLADVPGASANSGATLTAENSEGKAAFVSAETTASTQEVSVATGSEFRTLLNDAGQSEFLQLASAAKRKVNFGETKIKIEAGKTESEVKTITHGLGAKPIFVELQLETGAGPTLITERVTERTSTVFKAMFNQSAPAGATAEVTFLWVAIG